MIITINNKTYGIVNVIIDENVYIYKGLNNKKINVEYSKSKRNYYAYVMIHKKKIRLHRYITDCPKDMVVDHINGDTLDNRMENLRIVTQVENLKNRMSTLSFPPTSRNKFGVRGLMKLYDKRDKRYFYRVKLTGYKVKNFSLDKLEEAIEYAKNPESLMEHKENYDRELFL